MVSFRKPVDPPIFIGDSKMGGPPAAVSETEHLFKFLVKESIRWRILGHANNMVLAFVNVFTEIVGINSLNPADHPELVCFGYAKYYADQLNWHFKNNLAFERFKGINAYVVDATREYGSPHYRVEVEYKGYKWDLDPWGYTSPGCGTGGCHDTRP